MKVDCYEKGLAGERSAELFLRASCEKAGRTFEILARRWVYRQHLRVGEIDLIYLENGGTLVFTEVKCWKRSWDPRCGWSLAKRRAIGRAIRAYVAGSRLALEEVRVDLLIKIGEAPWEHLKGVDLH